ncbi:hypothetical protein H8E07_14625 [bacterium]|nr:hypothetical protein [bacterium]
MSQRKPCYPITVTVLVVLSFSSFQASAHLLTVETDQEVYSIHETAQITIHNPTQDSVSLVLLPVYFIAHVATGECVYNCPIVLLGTDLGPGDSILSYCSMSQIFLSTGLLGTYEIVVWEEGTGDFPLPAPPGTEFTLVPATPNDAQTWGAVKQLFH